MRILILTLISLLLDIANPGRAQFVPSSDLYQDPCGPGGGGGGGSCSGQTWCPPECSSCSAFSAIIVGTEQGDWDLGGLADPVTFDLGLPGGRQTIAWTARGSALMFLALDRNGNGVIDDGSELFGTASPTRIARTARNGFVALAEFDTNRDALIDESDPIFPSLLLWLDWDHDAVSRADEVVAVATTGVTSIELQHRWRLRRDRNGNYFAYEGNVRLGGTRHSMREVFMQRSR
jgi:hypothetical protein